MDFPDVIGGTASPVHLYANAPYISIYSSHIRSLVESCALSIFGLSRQLFRSRNRAAPVATARQTAIYLAHVAFGLTFTEIGHLFARDRSTVAHACNVIEELRDDPTIDQALTIIETVLARQRPAIHQSDKQKRIRGTAE